MNERLITAGSLIAPAATAAAGWLLTLPGGLLVLSVALASLLPAGLLYRQQRRLQASLTSLRSSLAASPHAVLLLDGQGQALDASPAFLQLAGLPASQPPATLLRQLPENWQTLIARCCQTSPAPGSAEAMLPCADGITLLRADSLPFRAPAGQALTLLRWENLSRNNQALNQLVEREQTLLARSQTFVQTLMDVIPQPVYIKRVEGDNSHYTQFNSAFCARHNRSPAELAGCTAFDLFSDSTQASMINQEDLRVLGGMPVFREEQSIDEQTGRDRYTIVCKQACEDAEGHPVVVGTNFDITPWRMAERNLKLALQREVDRRERVQAFVQRIIDVIPYPVHVKDASCRYLMVNEAFVRDRGRSREELLGKDPVAVVQLMTTDNSPAQDDERTRALISLQEDRKVLAGGTLTKEEHNFHSVTGAERFRTVFKAGCVDTEGNPAIVTAFFDVTEWRLAEREKTEALEREKALLHRTRAFTQRLIDLIPDEFYVKDAQSHYLLVNRAFLKNRRLDSVDQVIGHSMEEVASAACHANPHYQAHPELIAGAIADHRERARQSREEDLAVLAGQNLLKEDHSVLPHTGEERYFLVAKTVAEDAEGRPVIVCANFNITALRRAEQALAAHGLSVVAPDKPAG